MRVFMALLILGLIGTTAAAQSAAETAFVKRLFVEIQHASFAAGREFCGTIGLTGDGALVASRPRRGRATSCRPRDAWTAEVIIASYHTHGAFDPRGDSEVPSPDDVWSDIEDGTDGWVATPGGRLWFIDGATGVSRQVCGLGCLPMDPAFRPGFMGPVPESFTLDALERFFE